MTRLGYEKGKERMNFLIDVLRQAIKVVFGVVAMTGWVYFCSFIVENRKKRKAQEKRCKNCSLKKNTDEGGEGEKE